MPDFGTFSTNDLRFAAEGADSIRDEPAMLVVRDEKLLAIRTADLEPTDRPILDLRTASRGPGIPGDAKARIVWRGRSYGDKIPEFEKADALFLTQTAVQKFLLPYYMRFKSGAAVQALENKLFNDREVVAAFHIPGSITFGISQVMTFKPQEGSDEATCEMYPQ